MIHHTERRKRERDREGKRSRKVWWRGCKWSGAQTQNQSGKNTAQTKGGDRKRRREREKEREKEKVVISHPCSMQRKFNFHISSTTETKNIKQ